MADFGIWTKNADIQAKAGTGANATAKAEAATDVYVLEVESYVNVVARYNFSDNYATLNADVKDLVKEITSNLCAIYVIQWDMSGFTSRIEAENMINILWARAQQGIEAIKDPQFITWIKGQ
ncbi:MAG TPA: hypothetical protein VMX17_05285 [Candidatus Glassbacteria bacterium]|nr:hypothetical protein [Candidatus Glassbacteria bacterium]